MNNVFLKAFTYNPCDGNKKMTQNLEKKNHLHLYHWRKKIQVQAQFSSQIRTIKNSVGANHSDNSTKRSTIK